MGDGTYQLLALGACFVFIGLGAVIVLRAAMYLLGEHNKRKRRLRNLPDAGMVGELRDIESDRAYPLPREGVLGGGGMCDIRLRGLRRRLLDFAFVDGKGLLLTPCHSRSVILLGGQPLRKGGYALHGACLQVGGYTLRVRLFAGLNVPRQAAYQPDATWHPAFDEELYAPDYAAFNAVQPGYAPYPGFDTGRWESIPVDAGQQTPPPFEGGITADDAPPLYADAPPVYQSAPPIYPDALPVYQTAPPEYQDAPPAPFDALEHPAPGTEPRPFDTPARHRRSGRRKP